VHLLRLLRPAATRKGALCSGADKKPTYGREQMSNHKKKKGKRRNYKPLITEPGGYQGPDEEYEGAREIKQTPSGHTPGFTLRPHRVDEWILLKAIGLRKQDSTLGVEESVKQAKKEFEKFRQGVTAGPDLKAFEDTAPTCSVPVPSKTRQECEVAAVRWLPEIRWLSNFLWRKNNGRGFPGHRHMLIAVLLQMAFGRSRPELSSARDALLAGRPLLNWAHDYPDGCQARSTFFQTFRRLLESKPAAVLPHVNLALLKRLAAECDGKGRLRHKEVGKIGIVDATLIEADVAQKSPKSEKHRELLTGRRREKVRPVVYTGPEGNVRRFTHGYKLLAIICAETMAPMIWALVSASADERKETLLLLDKLFAIWPDCPLEILVGDGLYDGSIEFAHRLVFDYGIHPCFPMSAGYAAATPHLKSKGVPVCGCGEEMKFKDSDNYYTLERRIKEGIPRGQQAKRLDARLRWVCRNGKCKLVSTRPFDDPRLYTWLHHGGDHERASLRRALLVRRNAVESLFSSLKHLGLGGRAQERPRWACDIGMDWLLSLGLVFQTARRLVHENGLYQRAFDEAQGLGLLRQPSEQQPAPGPNELQLARARQSRAGALEPSQAPVTWDPEPEDQAA
jgi:hypothetical protein